jgi:hypothetical protein
MNWEQWKAGFDAWEGKTAELFEQLLKNPRILEPAGAVLTASMKLKAASENAMASWWSLWGLPTKRDQERTLHTLNQLNSRLIDLEERLAEANSKH